MAAIPDYFLGEFNVGCTATEKENIHADGNKSTFWINAAGALRLLTDSFDRSIAKLDSTAIRLSAV